MEHSALGQIWAAIKVLGCMGGMSSSTEIDDKSITKPASKVMVGGVLSLAGGLITNVIVAALFGARADMDAYVTALVVPNYFQIVFFSSLYFVLIPAFIDSESNLSDDDAWALVGTFFWIAAFLLLLVALLGSFFSAAIIDTIAPGFSPAKASLAGRMLAVLFYSLPLMGLTTLTVGIQNSRNRFFWPSVAPAFGSFANIVVLWLSSRAIGSMALCWGSIAATAAQAGFTIVPVLSHGWKRVRPLRDKRVRKIGSLMIPLVLFGLVVSFSPVADRYFASALPNGQIAYMGYVAKISGIFVALLASGIAAAIFPSMARTYALDGLPGLSQQQDFGLRLTFAVALPAVMIMAAVSTPFVTVLFERGAFLHTDTLGVSRIVFAYLMGDVIFRMVGNIFQRTFYVLRDMHTQLIVSTVLVGLYLATARFFVAHWGYVGLVWAGATRGGLGVLTLWVLLLRILPKTGLVSVFRSLIKYLSAALCAYLLGRLSVFLLASTSVLLQLTVGGLIGIGIYALAVYLLDREMLSYLLQLSGIPYVVESLESSLSRLSLKHCVERNQ